MNQDIVKGKWKELKGEIQKAWGKLTGDELEASKGDMTSIAGLIQKKYGEKKDSVTDRLNQIVGRFDGHVDRGHEDDRGDLARKTSEVKKTVREV